MSSNIGLLVLPKGQTLSFTLVFNFYCRIFASADVYFQCIALALLWGDSCACSQAFHRSLKASEEKLRKILFQLDALQKLYLLFTNMNPRDQYSKRQKGGSMVASLN